LIGREEKRFREPTGSGESVRIEIERRIGLSKKGEISRKDVIRGGKHKLNAQQVEKGGAQPPRQAELIILLELGKDLPIPTGTKGIRALDVPKGEG
jgi:hypothetical protein